MKTTHEITLTENEVKEALLDYINRSDGKFTWKDLKGFTLVNGTQESPVLITDIKFKASTL